MGYFIIKIMVKLVTGNLQILDLTDLCAVHRTSCFESSSWELSRFTPLFRKQEKFRFSSFKFLLQLMKNLRLPFNEAHTNKHLLIHFVLTSDEKRNLANYFFPSS